MSIAYLHAQLSQHHIPVTQQQLQQLAEYIHLLQHWNKAFNLVGNAETQQLIDRHIIDSLLAIPYLQGNRILDVGTGAGLPGIPLAIMLPEYEFLLLDSNGKKTRFITQAKLALQLHQVEVIQQRVENYQPALLFNTIISRAFAHLIHMLELTQHLCAPAGKFIALKGDTVRTELEQLPPRFICTQQQRLPFVDEHTHRQIIVIQQKDS